MSCLMHMYGLITRQKKPIQVMHVAEILAGRQPAREIAAKTSATPAVAH
jgi:L-lactate dehydrogenase complex protein LldE